MLSRSGDQTANYSQEGTIKTKICTLCKQAKPLEDFGLKQGPGSNRDGLNPRCRECHREECRDASQRYRDRHPEAGKSEASREAKVEYHASIAGRLSHSKAGYLRRCKKQGIVPRVEEFTDEQFFDIHGWGWCNACGRMGQPWTIDHIIPVSRGGKHSLDNTQLLCRDCNQRKATEIIYAGVTLPKIIKVVA